MKRQPTRRCRLTRYGFTRVEVCMLMAATGVLATALLPAVAQFGFLGKIFRNQDDVRRSACQSNLKQLALGIKQYIMDYDEMFPLVTGGSGNYDYGWAAATQPYIKSLQLLQCPSEKHEAGIDPRRAGYADYWYNRNLSRVNESRIEFISNTLLLGDGDGGHKASNARYAINNLPSSWVSTADSPARRHWDCGNYAFTDGHVKWMRPQSITTAKPNATIVTFRVE